MKKAINNIKQLEMYFRITLNEKEKLYLNYFFKKKVIQVNNNKIIYPKLDEIKKQTKQLTEQLKELKSKNNFWKKQKTNAEKYHKMIPINMYAKRNYWRHKIKTIINKEYKQDIEDAKLNERVLMDPEYKQLFETFLVDPDYRQKLKETVNNSIVYKNNNIGEYSKRKQKFKQHTAIKKIEQVSKLIIETDFKLKINLKVAEYLKRFS